MARRILVIGGSGYVGKHLVRMLPGTCETTWTYFSHPQSATGAEVRLDIRDESSVRALVAALQPDIVFHLAYSQQDLDGCIVAGASHIVDAWKEQDANSRLIYLSTDAVFDGERAPYSESDTPVPIYPYGRAKREAELAVLAAGGHVVRTSIVYGFDPPDPRTAAILQGARTGGFPHSYFSDEIRSPVFVQDLCSALIELMNRLQIHPVLHVAGPEPLSRYEIATKIAESYGLDRAIPCGTLSGSGLNRPRDVALNVQFAQSVLSTRMRGMDRVIQDCVLHRAP